MVRSAVTKRQLSTFLSGRNSKNKRSKDVVETGYRLGFDGFALVAKVRRLFLFPTTKQCCDCSSKKKVQTL